MTKIKTPDVFDLGLDKLGIKSAGKLYYQLTFDELFKHETNKSLKGNEKGILTEFDTITVDTGRFTGRSPKDKYIVGGGNSSENVWWAGEDSPGSDNKAVSLETWEYLYDLVVGHLDGKDLYVMDGYCGANKNSCISTRMVTEIAWQAHFFKNMFIRPETSELDDFTPDWTILNACKVVCKDYKKHGLNSEVFVVVNIEKKTIIIGGTWYGGEIKKGMFSVMHYVLPQKEIGVFHCSANMGSKGDTALFFGLSGTGKTTLSTDPDRKLIGDDEHGWDNDGIFNFEGGCYAKVINLSREHEPDIFNAIKRDALLENVVVDGKGKVDFTDGSKTQNTRVSYPINHIKNIVTPVSVGKHPKIIIFLTCDSFGVLPPVAKLNKQQAEYMFLSGYTAKVAGTERGIDEPKAVFSACFSAPFLMLHPTVYAKILGEKMEEHGANVYLVNTGWTGGGYGVGHRMPLPVTRKIVSAIFSGEIEKADYDKIDIFDLDIPVAIKGVDSKLLNPKLTWSDKKEYARSARRLARMFVENFKTFTDTKEGKELEKAGPKI